MGTEPKSWVARQASRPSFWLGVAILFIVIAILRWVIVALDPEHSGEQIALAIFWTVLALLSVTRWAIRRKHA